MPELTGHHVGLTVSNLDRAVAFYRDVLGLSVLSRFAVGGDAFATGVDVEGASATFAHLDAGDVRLELVSYDPEGPAHDEPSLNEPGAAHVGLAVDDVQAVADSLPADAETLSEPQTTESGTTIMFVRDPEGNLIEILDA